jgi:TPR repeat protein
MLSLAAPVAAGPLEDGYTAYTRSDFATAMRLLRPLADQGDVTIGLMHYFTYGDYVSAYMWFNLAAAQGNTFADMFLKDTADKMTPEKIAEAQKLARAGSRICSRLVRVPHGVENEGCSVYQCLDCKFVEWLPQDK